jgi:hypothetical protein
MKRQATWTVVAMGGLAAVVAVSLVAWWPSSDASSRPGATDSWGTTSIAGSATWGGSGTDPLASPPATNTDHGALVAVGMRAGTRYAFRLRIDATGITKCIEPSAWPDHPDCLNNGSSELPVLAVFGPPERRWVWSTMPTHQAAHPQMWIHYLDGTLTVVPLEAHGRLAWPAAAALLRGDERTAELRDGTTVLNSLYIQRTKMPDLTTPTTATPDTATQTRRRQTPGRIDHCPPSRRCWRAISAPATTNSTPTPPPKVRSGCASATSPRAHARGSRSPARPD